MIKKLSESGFYPYCFFLIILIFSTSTLANTIEPAPQVSLKESGLLIAENALSQGLTINIAADSNYPPYEFLNDQGEPAGYSVELTKAIAQVMGFKVNIVMTDWQNALRGLYSGEFDALQNIAYSDERAKSIIFSPPHSIANQAIFARTEDPKIHSLEALKNKTVLVQNASIMHEYLIAKNIDAVIVPTKTHTDALRQLSAGKYDFALVANLPSLYLSKEFNLNNIQPIFNPVDGQRLSYGALAGNEDLIARFSEGLAILKNTGVQQKIYDKWLGALENKKSLLKTIGPVAIYILGFLGLIFIGIIVWNSMLRKEVEKRSQQLKAQQQQLIQADKMASLGVLVSGVAHEINNPTGLLIVNLPLLKSAWEDALPYLERLQENEPISLAGLSFERIKTEMPYIIDEMNHSTIKIRDIVNDLKDFARIESEDNKSHVSLNHLVSTAVRLVDTSIRNATTQFELSLDPKNPHIYANAQRIEQVIINLLINACDALEDTTKRIRLTTSYYEDQQSVIMKFEDQGHGIKEEHLSRLSEPFFTTKRDIGGTGLGLSVSSGIIASHHGSISFNSAIGIGTTVTVTLPVVQTIT
ncbi:transporter substrate-binding domain-containing protein [Marinomonas sp. 15G1-11]|uniref:histidine kinase n=1 Tax=Marinomonas phaeophyticola TaxID=3004091 RepID=A0ABT4JVP2_9GAMM|nr:transporter substrate-binding domain-containing protein [Marinomonas sp. 15G1-11]MCZ2722451.1 transporter substrate-binding domain-containing protein [Marinomonas sp. 15G1-11]